MKNDVKGNTLAKSDARQTKRNETGFPYTDVSPDSTQAVQNSRAKGEAFCESGQKQVIKKIGMFTPQENKNSHTANRGWDTLASDSRNDPLAGTDVPLAFPNANQKTDVRTVEAGDLGRKKPNLKGNVLAG